ncbi:hypothetical protein [Nocardia sp. NPDC005745]|uniref:hypothetical protein n=1 Tax=Nocardia sp. NPDC005745 TaxID=3157061 RepID=UPI0033F509E6
MTDIDYATRIEIEALVDGSIRAVDRRRDENHLLQLRSSGGAHDIGMEPNLFTELAGLKAFLESINDASVFTAHRSIDHRMRVADKQSIAGEELAHAICVAHDNRGFARSTTVDHAKRTAGAPAPAARRGSRSSPRSVHAMDPNAPHILLAGHARVSTTAWRSA